jgi:hypothetical protein
MALAADLRGAAEQRLLGAALTRTERVHERLRVANRDRPRVARSEIRHEAAAARQ